MVFGCWCGKCAKYLAFGTFTTSSVDALIEMLNDRCFHFWKLPKNLGWPKRRAPYIVGEGGSIIFSQRKSSICFTMD